MKLYIETLGCSKNLVDSELMLGMAGKAGYTLVGDADEADIVVVNTCSFIHDAKEESVEEILQMGERKRAGQIRHLIVAGCLSERYPGELFEELPEVDAFIGTTHFDEIVDVIERVKGGERLVSTGDIDRPYDETLPRIVTTPDHYAYVKIAEGCDNRCTYCIIPKLRGAYRSRTIEAITAEVEALAAKGVKEVILISQDSSRYGMDLYEAPALPALFNALDAIEGLEWVRVQYLYPDILDEKMIRAFAESEKVVPYFDIPMQHASDDVLKRMNRHTNRADLERIVATIRALVPGAVIRTTLIAGFPGETPEDHAALMTFLKEQALDKVGVFSYSDEEDTPAYRLPGKLDDGVKDQRRDELMALQMQISEAKQYEQVGRVERVLIEEQADEGVFVGRTATNAPDVDGVVYVHTALPLEIGTFYEVTITDALEYDLIGEISDEHRQ